MSSHKKRDDKKSEKKKKKSFVLHKSYLINKNIQLTYGIQSLRRIYITLILTQI